MRDIALDCPYCSTKNAGFEGEHFKEIKANIHEYILFLQCKVCGQGLIAVYRSTSEAAFKYWLDGKNESGGDLIQIWPKPPKIAAPEHTPPNVASFYRQGMENLGRHFDAAGTMFRKSLDTSLKHLDSSLTGTLYQRIEKLPPTKGVTPAMKEWAHEIRDLGNDAAHEDDPFSEEEAKTLQAFTELFLTYAFTLPGMIEARKAQAAATTT